MPFFGREDRSPADEPAAPAEGRTHAAGPARPQRPAARGGSSGRTSITRGLTIEGTVTGGELVHIEGTVDGEIRVDGGVVIGGDGHVKGRVEAGQVTVKGRLEGNLAASEKAEVTTSGRVDGDIEAPRVIIAEGAFFKGNVKMAQPATQAAARKGQP